MTVGAAIAFQEAQRLAADCAVTQLEEAALDLGSNEEFFGHTQRVRQALCRAQRDKGCGGLYDIDGLPEAIHEDAQALLNHWSDAEYLYGLAIGLALGKGGAR